MLLRRITQHIKKENWFAVAIDFLIVVFGVFVGLQVQQWASERARIQSESNYLDRLHEEVIRAIQVRKDLVEERTSNRLLLGQAHQLLFAEPSDQELSLDQCEAINEAYIYSNITADLPTTAELISAGNLAAISSIEVRSRIISLEQTAKRALDIVAALNINSVTLSQTYPNLIKLSGVSKTGQFSESSFRADCDTHAMRLNPNFMNDFVESHFRYILYEEGAVQTVSAELQALHLSIDNELSFKHKILEDKP